MESLTLTIKDLNLLNTIKSKLNNRRPFAANERNYLSKFLNQLPSDDNWLVQKIQFDESFDVKAWNFTGMNSILQAWKKLFDNIPGYDYAGCNFVGDGERRLLVNGVIMIVEFAPSCSYNMANSDGYSIYLKDDGTARFWFPTFEDAEQFPELYNFKGSWKEAYLLLIQTLENGWPIEEFPEELKPLLKN